MTNNVSEISVPGPDLSDEQLLLFQINLARINIAKNASKSIDRAEIIQLPFIILDPSLSGEKKKKRQTNKERFENVLKKHPTLIDDAYAELREPAMKLGIGLSQFHACVNGIKRSLQSGKEPTNRLRQLFAQKWKDAESSLDQIPASFRKTVAGPFINLAYNPSCIEVLQEFRSYSSSEKPSLIEEILELFKRHSVEYLMEGRYFEDPQRYAAYDIVKDIAPSTNIEFTSDVEEGVNLYLSDCINSWRSFLDNPPSRRVAPGPRQHYFGPTPPTREVAMYLYYLCSNKSLRARFRTPLLALSQMAVRMQDGNGAWTDAFSVRSENWNSSIRDECTFSTIFMVLALNEMAESVDYSTNIDNAVKWLIRSQKNDGSFADTSPDYDNSSCLTILACMILDELAEGAEASIDRAHDYLLSKQNSFGFWDGSKPLTEFHITAFALRYFLGRHRKGEGLGQWGQSARRFQSIAEDILARGDVTSAKLAVVACHHAVEFALYDVICSFHSGSIYVSDTRDETLGVRGAKARLRDLVREAGIIGPMRDLPHSTQISQHASIRDNIVHRNLDVDQSTAQQTIKTSRKFIENILGYRP